MAVTGQSFLPHLSSVHSELVVSAGADIAPIGVAGPEREDSLGDTDFKRQKCRSQHKICWGAI